MQIFKKNGLIIYLEKENNESYEQHIERAYYILDTKWDKDVTWDEKIMHSKIYINNKYFGCCY